MEKTLAHLIDDTELILARADEAAIEAGRRVGEAAHRLQLIQDVETGKVSIENVPRAIIPYNVLLKRAVEGDYR